MQPSSKNTSHKPSKADFVIVFSREINTHAHLIICHSGKKNVTLGSGLNIAKSCFCHAVSHSLLAREFSRHFSCFSFFILAYTCCSLAFYGGERIKIAFKSETKNSSIYFYLHRIISRGMETTYIVPLICCHACRYTHTLFIIN